MEISDNPFAAPRAMADARFVAKNTDVVRHVSMHATAILRTTRPAVRLLGVIPLLISVVAFGVALYIQIVILPRVDLAVQNGEFEAFFCPIVCLVVCSGLFKLWFYLYIFVGWLFRGYSKSIKVHLNAPDEASMIAALDSHGSLLKGLAIFTLTIVVVALLLGVGALALLGWQKL